MPWFGSTWGRYVLLPPKSEFDLHKIIWYKNVQVALEKRKDAECYSGYDVILQNDLFLCWGQPLFIPVGRGKGVGRQD